MNTNTATKTAAFLCQHPMGFIYIPSRKALACPDCKAGK